MKHRKILHLTAAICGSSLAVNGAPFLRVSDNAELFLTGKVGLSHDDNIFFSSVNETSSGILELEPGIEFKFGQGALLNGVFAYQETFRRYFDASEQNTELSNVTFTAKYNDVRTEAGLDASFQQLAQNSRDVTASNDIVRRDETRINPYGEWTVSPKTRLGLGYVFAKTDYRQGWFTDRDTHSVPLDAYFEVTPKLSASVGYRYRDNRLDGTGIDSEDHFFNVGARGEFSPKLHGTVKVGYNQRNPDQGATRSNLGVLANLSYLYSKKTTFRLSVNNDFANAATGENQKVFSVTGGVSSHLTPVLAAGASVTYGNYKYQVSGRDDDYYDGNVNLSYYWNDYVSLSGGYTYRKNSSNVSLADFGSNVFSVVASLRY